MKNFRNPVYIALFLIAATAVWYFGHHRPAQKILKAEPERCTGQRFRLRMFRRLTLNLL